MLIIGTKEEQNIGIKNMYEVYYKSVEFETSLCNVLKLDEIYGNLPKVGEIFERVFSGKVLEGSEFSLVKRILSDDYILKSLSQTLSDKDFDIFIGKIKQGTLSEMQSFYYPVEDNKEKNREVVMHFIIQEFLSAIKNYFISNVISENLAGVEGIIGEYGGEQIENIQPGKKYSLVRVGEIYHLYDNQEKRFSDEYFILDKEIISLKNGEKVLVVVPKISQWEQYVISLETGEKLTPNFKIGHNLETYPTQTIIFMRLDSTLNQVPYSLEKREFLDPEVFPVPKRKDFLSMAEVDALLKGVTGEVKGTDLISAEADEWAATMADLQNSPGEEIPRDRLFEILEDLAPDMSDSFSANELKELQQPILGKK